MSDKPENPQSKDSQSINDKLQGVNISDVPKRIHDPDDKGLTKPDVFPGKWITVRNCDAVVCNVFDEPGPQGSQIEVVYLYDRNRAINRHAKLSESGWIFLEDMGGPADNYPRLQDFVLQLRRGRWK